MGTSIAGCFEVIVVDDGSRDSTSEIVRDLQHAHPEFDIRLVRHRHNRGYGAALRSGFRASRYDWVFYTDGDGQFDMCELVPLVCQIGQADLLIGYRAPRRDGSLVRTLLGRAWTSLSNAALGMHVVDVNCAFKLFPKTLLDAIPMTSRGAAIDAEILGEALRRGMRVAQVPVTHRPRVYGLSSATKASVMARALLDLADVARRVRKPVAPTQKQTRLRPVRLAS